MSEGQDAPPAQPPPAEAPEAAAPPGGGRWRLGFVGNVNLVFFTYAANALLAFGVAVLVARALGPDGRGVYALFLLSASIAQSVLGLGLNVSAVYYLGKGTHPLSRVVANGQQVAIAAALVSGVLVLVAWPLFGDTLLDHDVPFWAFAFVVPLFLNYNFVTTVLQGLSRFLAMNVTVVAQPLVLLTLLVAGTAFADVDTATAVVFWAVATLVATAIAFPLMGRAALRARDLLRVDPPSLRAHARFGLQGQLGNLVQLLNYRLDQYVVLLFVSTAGVGIYAVSVTVSQSVWFFANAVAVVLLPRLTAADEAEAARTTPLVCRSTLLVSALGAGALAALSPWLIEGLFGGEFSGALVPMLWLLPGAVALAGSKVLSSYIFSQGRPLTNSLITLASMAVTLVADFALIPTLEVTGAAIASSIAYATHFAFSLLAYRALSGGSVLDAVLVRGEDFRRYVEMARRRLAPAQP